MDMRGEEPCAGELYTSANVSIRMEQVEERSLAMANCGKEERKYQRERDT
jgi:hypothetical protein